jgi:hypothetical protein
MIEDMNARKSAQRAGFAASARDIQWIRKHTEFTEFAQRWHAAGRPGSAPALRR